MKSIATVLVLLAMLIDPTRVGKINTLKSDAKKAYLAGDYNTAVKKYRYLVDSMQVNEDEILLNLANAYFQLNDTTHATGHYQTLTQSAKSQIRSKAELQLGVMNTRQGKFNEALNHFKQAIKNDPSNKDARYNYEILKKKLDYPEFVISRAKQLVKDQKYKEARSFLKEAQKKDKRIRTKFGEFSIKLNIVIKIDSLSRS